VSAPAAPARAAITLPVSGMTCAACQSHVQHSLSAVPGVLAANVNLATRSARVEYEPARTTPAQLVEAVREGGYDAELPLEGATPFEEQAAQDRANLEEQRAFRSKAMVSLVLGVVAMIVSMPLMKHGEHGGDPFMSWSARVIDPPLRTVMPWL
jgi:P-type Cu+ transporter